MDACPSCGTQVTSDAVFCHECGTSLKVAPTQLIEPSPDLDLAGTVIADRYHIEEWMGKGGMASVWRASRTIGDAIGRQETAPAVVKILDQGLVNHNPKAFEMFVSEATIASKVDSPHVVTVYDVGRDSKTGLVFIGMQLLNGVTLDNGVDGRNPTDKPWGPLYQKKQWILSGRQGPDPLPVSRTCNIIEQVLEAMAAVHNMQPEDPVIHRDLKPSNLILGKTPSGGDFVYVLDFGIARFREAKDGAGGHSFLSTSEKTILGTYPYMSPEHWTKDFCAGSDIFQIGIILYEMVTGRKPFGGDDGEADVTILNNILNHPSMPFDERESGLPKTHPLRHVIDKALEKNLDERYQTCEEFLRDLRSASAHPSITAPESAPQFGWQHVTGLVIGGGLFGWLGYLAMDYIF